MTRTRRETERLLGELARLVRREQELRARGATEQELAGNRLAVDRLRRRLAGAARRSAAADGPQAA